MKKTRRIVASLLVISMLAVSAPALATCAGPADGCKGERGERTELSNAIGIGLLIVFGVVIYINIKEKKESEKADQPQEKDATEK